MFAHKPQKSWLEKKGFTCRKTGFLFPFQKKKVLCYTKTGIAKAKKCKNRIYLRKKGDDKNRKKKDFFPPTKTKHLCLNPEYLFGIGI